MLNGSKWRKKGCTGGKGEVAVKHNLKHNLPLAKGNPLRNANGAMLNIVQL